MKFTKLIIIIFLLWYIAPIKVKTEEYVIKKNETFLVTAPTGVGEEILGMAFNNEFNPLNFKVFDGQKKTTTEARYSMNYTEITNTAQLSANAKIFSFIKGGYNKNQDERYAVLNIYYIDKTVTLTPNANLVENAAFYAEKIHYGWSLNYLISGKTDTFTKELSSNLQKWINTGGEFRSCSIASELTQELQLIGLSGKSDGVTIAITPEETLNQFSRSKEPVPILIEYKTVKDVNTEGINWASEYYTPGEYKIEYVDYNVSQSKLDGKNWDVGFGNTKNPDVIFTISVDHNTLGTYIGSKDTFKQMIRIDKKTNLTSKSNIEIKFDDKDMSENDDIGTASISFREIAKNKNNSQIRMSLKGSLQSCYLKLTRIK